MLLKTDRLTLKPVQENNIKVFRKMVTDSSVRKHLFDNRILKSNQVNELISKSQEHFEKDKFGIWLIEDNNKKALTGFAGLWYFFEEAQPQLIYALLPEYTKQGFASEAARKIIQYSFEELDYQYLIASCDDANIESQKVLEKLGMKRFAEKIVDGTLILLFRLEKENYDKSNS